MLGMAGNGSLVLIMYLSFVTSYFLDLYEVGGTIGTSKHATAVGIVGLVVYVSAYTIGSLVLGKMHVRMGIVV